jgi:hypothetical protein
MFGYNEKHKRLWGIALSVIAVAGILFALCCARTHLTGSACRIADLIDPPYKGPVKVVSKPDGWGLTVGGRPFFVRGVCYQYTEIGSGPLYGIYSNINKPWITDGRLMKSMGVNAVRIYGTGHGLNEPRVMVRDLFNRYGIKTAMGHSLGIPGSAMPDYADIEFRAKMKNEAVQMVQAYKDEPGILFWILGNDDMAGAPAPAAREKAAAYYLFVNDVAEAIKSVDPDHPVVMAVSDIETISIAKDLTPSVDILGGISYNGESFEDYFQTVKARYGKPNVFVEFGADRYDSVNGREAQNWQAAFLTNSWNEIERNKPGSGGVGNSLGGFVFEWSDEWWRYMPAQNAGWKTHDTGASVSNAAYHFDSMAGKNMNDEWWGVVALDPSAVAGGTERRVPTEAYYALQRIWTTPFRRAGYAVGNAVADAGEGVSGFISAVGSRISGTVDMGRAPSGPVKVADTPDGWVMTVGGKPYFVKGVCYHYIEVSKDKDYDMFADKNRPWITDGALMKKMGVNTIRLYRGGRDVKETKALIRDMFERYGIKTAIGHFLAFWDWPPANYGDLALRDNIKVEVLGMVRAYKDEPGILFWVLGNENNYSFDLGVRAWSTPDTEGLPPLEARREKAKIYYSFINELALAIKAIDPNHPVVMGNGELASIDVAREYAPDVDILGGIVYQGKTFGTYFERLKRNYGKPNCFVEFGAERYDSVWSQEAEDWQAFFLKLQWLEIVKNKAGGTGAGNSLGGFVFEWSDEWWKHNQDYAPGWRVHDSGASWANTAYYFDAKAGNNMSEEWWGIVGLDPKYKSDGIEKRVPKKAYYVLKELWTGRK